MQHNESPDLARRFGGVSKLFGQTVLDMFRSAHIAVIGIGGVGSWAVEGLARSGIGELTLIDLDMIAESNVNRQIHAIDPLFGQAKIEAMKNRILAINPTCKIHLIEDFVTPENVATYLPPVFDFVIDAIDHVKTKAAMIHWCTQNRMSIICAGGAGGKVDPTRLRISDLAHTIQDPLLSRVRATLRKEYGFSRDSKKKFGVQVVYSEEPIQQSKQLCDNLQPFQSGAGLNCAGYGSFVGVTASAGLFAASTVLNQLAQKASGKK